MRRLGMIVALCTLLGMVGGVVTGTPALAGRGPKWEFLPAKPFTLPAAFCGFKVRVTIPVNKEYSKILKSSDGSMITLITGAARLSYTNLSTGKTITANESGPAKTTVNPDGSAVVAFKGHTGFFLGQPAQSNSGFRSGERDCRAADGIVRRGREPDLGVLPRPRPGGRVRRAELAESGDDLTLTARR